MLKTQLKTFAALALALAGTPLLKAQNRQCEPVIMYGGNFETWTWDGTSWNQRYAPISPYSATSMTYDKTRHVVVLFGTGADGSTIETWEWDGSAWTQEFPLANLPNNFGGTMAYDIALQEMVVQGAAYVDGRGFIQETWVYKDEKWTQVFPKLIPDVLGSSAFVYDPDTKKIIMFGGVEPGGHFGATSTMEWDGTNWAYATTATSPQGLLGGQTAAYDASRHQMVLVSQRISLTGAGVPETWLWKGTSWKQVFPKAQPLGGGMAYDVADHTTVLFTPAGVSPFPQTWTWNGTDWKQKTPLTQPSTDAHYIMSSNAIPKTCPGGKD